MANREKIWVRGPMPGTLDEAMDFLSAEYDIQIPTADLLYSNPYEALMTAIPPAAGSAWRRSANGTATTCPTSKRSWTGRSG